MDLHQAVVQTRIIEHGSHHQALKGVTITVKFEVDLEGLPPEEVRDEDLANLERWAQELKGEMLADLVGDPELSRRMKVSLKMERHEVDTEGPEMDIQEGSQVAEIIGSEKSNVHLMSTLNKDGHD